LTTTALLPLLWDYDAIAGGLLQHGWVHLPDGLSAGLALDLLQDIHRHQSDQWDQASIGRRRDRHTNDLIRRDSTRWLTGDTTAQRQYLDAADDLRLELNKRLMLGLWDYECHYARYDSGAFYRRHNDAFHGRTNRVLSTVTYLNPDWQNHQGGELMLYDEQNQLISRLLPTLGSMVIFLSEEFPHEVLAAKRTRFSIAGWYRNNNSIQNRIDPNQ
jgi:SM-20-related protein